MQAYGVDISTCGLSPLARGKRRGRIRLTKLPAVYPRWRGENLSGVIRMQIVSGLSPLARGNPIPYSSAYVSTGLSPLARGKRAAEMTKAAYTRFIPAGAGKTTDTIHYLMQHTVYPRWRGENQGKTISLAIDIGLSPLARGKRRTACVITCQPRFIPAGAGKTRCLADCITEVAVYPRWRGENAYWHLIITDTRGLSPLARGKL
ncbi:Domain of uncharacterised function (DUF2825) [Salmonella enterica subsp. enterica]|nr:Domain of uncharacterised function (DUF2825) [Salmonella enterica subsp. enterica]